MFNLVNQLNSYILVPTALFATKMMTQASFLIPDFNLMVAVPQFEDCLGFSNILALAFGTSDQINYIVTLAI